MRHQHISAHALVILGHHHRIAARHRHAALRPIFHAVTRGQYIIRRGQAQIASCEDHDRLIQIINRTITFGAICGGGDDDSPFGFQAPNLTGTAGAFAGWPSFRRRATTRAIARQQQIRINRDPATHRPRRAARNHQLLILVPFHAITRCDFDGAALIEVHTLRPSSPCQQGKRQCKTPLHCLPSNRARDWPVKTTTAPLS